MSQISSFSFSVGGTKKVESASTFRRPSRATEIQRNLLAPMQWCLQAVCEDMLTVSPPVRRRVVPQDYHLVTQIPRLRQEGVEQSVVIRIFRNQNSNWDLENQGQNHSFPHV